MSMTLIIVGVAVLAVFLLVMAVGSFMQSGSDRAQRRVKDRLRALAMTGIDDNAVDLVLRETTLSDVPMFNRLLERMQWSRNFNRLLYQADAKGSAGTYLLVCALLAVIGFYAGTFSERLWVSLCSAALLGYLPVGVLRTRKRKRMDRFQKQLPEALEFESPIGPEFGKTLDEINYGLDVDRALTNLQGRVDCPDLKFFVVSVNIQRETGGNLAEIIAKIAGLVRERFALYGKIRVLSAEGRVSAYILIALPFLITGILYAVNADYISLLWTRELGQNMVWAAAFSMVFGALIIRKIITIKV
jgi:tight adherence protein B